MKISPAVPQHFAHSALIAGTPIAALLAALAQLDLLRADAHSVEALLRSVAIRDEDLTPFLFFAPGRYTRNLIFRNDDFELLALGWSAGSRSSIHDHGANRCFVKVQSGSLLADEYSLVAGGREPGYAQLARPRMVKLNAGDIDVRTPVVDIHRFSAQTTAATTLHVYAKPLDTFLVFDEERQTCKTGHSRYDAPADAVTFLKREAQTSD